MLGVIAVVLRCRVGGSMVAFPSVAQVLLPGTDVTFDPGMAFEPPWELLMIPL